MYHNSNNNYELSFEFEGTDSGFGKNIYLEKTYEISTNPDSIDVFDLLGKLVNL